ncbi:MAG: urease accessory protein UreJ [Alphaproteobacteria bacterium]|nr:urease accessory protein UreJ [Alphaproteobacteria bacterium]
MTERIVRRLVAVLAGVALAGPAAAHHVMDGRLPASFLDGLLSGLGHPIIGLDHLAFLLAVGAAVGLGRLSLAAVPAFVIASALGVGLHVGGLDLPAGEALVAASVLAAGAGLAAGAQVRLPPTLALFALAGLLHGHAYGESIYGAEPSPLAAYLAGLVLIQMALAGAMALVARRLPAPALPMAARLAGAAVAMVGAGFLAQQALAG